MKIRKILLVFLLLFIITLSFGCNKNKKEEVIYDSNSLYYHDELIPTYSIHTELQNQFLTGDYKLGSVLADGTKEVGKPLAVTIDFSDIVEVCDSYQFIYSENDKFTEYKEITVSNSSVDLINLKINCSYYYKVKYNDKVSEIKAFRINDAMVRCLDIDGVTNFRDIGGYFVDGKPTNQGLIYRSSKFNQDESTDLVITSDGINELVNNLKIKTEIDLRATSDNENGGLTASPLGEGVKYISIPMKSSGNIILLNPNELITLFTYLGDSNNYPLVFHCSIGTDRTGMVAFILNALLGVENDALYYDYMFSNFAVIGKRKQSTVIDTYLTTIAKGGGETTKDKVYNYLISIGVNKTDIDNYIKIMTK